VRAAVALCLAVLTGCSPAEPAEGGAATATTTPTRSASFRVVATGDVLITRAELSCR
jgi:hypothetical protein